MKTAKTILCVLAAAMAVTLFAAKEPTISVNNAKAECKKAAVKAECKKAAVKAECKACPKAVVKNCIALPAGSVLQKEFSDDVTQSFKAPDGKIYLKYVWKKPATVYSLYIQEKQKFSAGREMMTIAPEGRSKGKVKMMQAAKVDYINPGLYPSAIITEGMILATFLPSQVIHDSVDNESASGGKMPGWGEAFVGLWKSTGICDLISQGQGDFAKTWNLSLGRVVMMLVALVLIYLAIVK